jgi:hypothetical protein
MNWDEQLASAQSTWSEFCRSLESVGNAALAKTLTRDEVDLAEGVRYLARLTRMTLFSSLENNDSQHPYFWTALDPHIKMGGDNPQGLYLSAPINGKDTFRLSGTRGSARWVSMILAQQGLPSFGNALFLPDLTFAEDGTFEVVISPERHVGNWLQSDERTNGVLVRQFFPTPDDVTVMDLKIENLTAPDAPPARFNLETALAGLRRAGGMFGVMVPMMQQELLDKGERKNSFKTDVGDHTSNAGGVPGGNAVTARWALEADEALLVTVTPPDPCAYWDVQVGNGWYESFDYRHHFSGLTCEGAQYNDDGSFTIVVANEDPGVVNWLETVGHREGHIAIRWQLSDDLPIPETRVVPVVEVARISGLPAVPAEARAEARAFLADSWEARFR